MSKIFFYERLREIILLVTMDMQSLHDRSRINTVHGRTRPTIQNRSLEWAKVEGKVPNRYMNVVFFLKNYICNFHVLNTVGQLIDVECATKVQRKSLDTFSGGPGNKSANTKAKVYRPNV